MASQKLLTELSKLVAVLAKQPDPREPVLLVAVLLLLRLDERRHSLGCRLIGKLRADLSVDAASLRRQSLESSLGLRVSDVLDLQHSSASELVSWRKERSTRTHVLEEGEERLRIRWLPALCGLVEVHAKELPVHLGAGVDELEKLSLAVVVLRRPRRQDTIADARGVGECSRLVVHAEGEVRATLEEGLSREVVSRNHGQRAGKTNLFGALALSKSLAETNFPISSLVVLHLDDLCPAKKLVRRASTSRAAKVRTSWRRVPGDGVPARGRF